MARGSKTGKPAVRTWFGRRKRELPPTAAPSERPSDPQVIVVDGRPEYHRAGCPGLAGAPAVTVPFSQAVEDGFTPCPGCAPVGAPSPEENPAVWVVDGSPEYHEQTCSTLAGREAEPILLSQALEDGFVRCVICTPPAGAAELGAGGPTPSTRREVWVVDGHPEYHHKGCVELRGLEAEPVPYEQAVEDGFQPCVVCNPDIEFAGPSTPPPGAADPAAAPTAPEVWVVDGRPEYHRAECVELVGRDGELIPHTQAVEDGFVACRICMPDGEPQRGLTGPEVAEPADEPAQTGDQVWVVDGFPDYHRPGCIELVGLDGEPIPWEQAVEDGFAPCAVCMPAAAQAPARPASHPGPLPDPEPVLVAMRKPEPEGQPEPQAEPEPHGQPEPKAEPEPQAEPESVAEPEPVTATAAVEDAARVWVVDGRSRFHTQDCLIISAQKAHALPLAEAVEIGFLPCSLCQRKRD